MKTRNARQSLKLLTPRYKVVICTSNDGFEASLERRKVYLAIPDKLAAKDNLLRVIDESGEDYLYPIKMFRYISLEARLRKTLGLVADPR